MGALLALIQRVLAGLLGLVRPPLDNGGPTMPDSPTTLSHVRLTQYWIVKCAAGATPVHDSAGNILGYVSDKSLSDLLMEGTGDLPDGPRVNYAGAGAFEALPEGVWGYGVGKRALIPLESIAVDPEIIPLDSTVTIPSLGLTLKAQDIGPDIKGNHIDLFVGYHNPADSYPDYVDIEVA